MIIGRAAWREALAFTQDFGGTSQQERQADGRGLSPLQ
jgi:hypothetical protein